MIYDPRTRNIAAVHGGRLEDYLRQLRNSPPSPTFGFNCSGNIRSDDQIIVANFADIEARALGLTVAELNQREALGLVVVTFSATKAEQMAVLYGMRAARRWDTFVSDETKARMRRRRRRAR